MVTNTLLESLLNTKRDTNSDRIGGYIGTLNGRRFYPLDPRADEVNLQDISHALSRKCRWGCYTKSFYTVAQHVLHGLKLAKYIDLGPEEHLRELIMKYFALHDAHEAYLADVPSPVKPFIPGWFELEEKVDLSVFEHFGLGPIPKRIKEYVVVIDKWSLGMEVGTVKEPNPSTNYPSPPPAKLAIMAPVVTEPQDVDKIKLEFISKIGELFPNHVS